MPALINFLSFYVFGIPFGVVLGYSLGWGTHGLWAGLDMSLCLIVFGHCMFIHCTVDWDAAARQAQERASVRSQAEGDGLALRAADSADLSHC